jgi:tricarballylate dehydrogenase
VIELAGSTFDVVVAGGGNAGLCAALAARDAGASVLVLEHALRTMRGGNSRHTRNLRLMHDAPMQVLNDTYSEAEYWDDLVRVTAGKTDEQLARLTIRQSAGLMAWMQAHGARFQPSLSGTLNLSRTNAFFLGGGKALLNAYYATAERLGVVVAYDTEVETVQLEGDVVRSLVVKKNGASMTIHARAVVVAAGGFQANLDWLAEYWGEAARNFVVRGTPFATGTVLRDLLAQSVQPVGDPTQFHAIAIDARAPKFDSGIVTRLDCVPFSIVVDREGNRFYDEGEDLWPKRYAIWGRLIAQRAGQIAYAVFDSKAKDLFMPSVFPAIRADSIAELAQLLGIDADALRATVASFNGAVQPGAFNPAQLDDCRTTGLGPAKSHWARTIDVPPYFAYPLRPGITFTYLGVRVDERARVLMADGHRTRNLFAAGEIMAGNILGQGYLAGLGMTIGSVFGRIAGEEAAKCAAA